MSEENKAAVRRFYDEIFNGKCLDVIDEMCDVNFVDHSPLPNQAAGRQGIRTFSGCARAPFQICA
jgi:hypothetical protein